MTNEERKNYYMNRNVKLSPLMLALTWDVIFVWVITNLFLTTQKGFSNSQVVLLDSVLMLAGCVMCVPITKLFQNIKPVTATRIGLCGYVVWLFLYMVGNSFPIFICAQFFLAFGYCVLGVKSNMILTQSLSVIKRDKDYQRVYGKGMSLFYLLEFFGSMGIIYVYNWQPNMVFVISIFVVLFCILYTFLFKEPSKFMQSNVVMDSKVDEQSFNKKPDSFGKILTSTFFIFLLVYAFFFRGILSVSGQSLKIYLNFLVNENTIPLWSYGYIYAVSRLVISLTSKLQFRFNLKWGVRSLIILNIALIASFVVTGLTYILLPGSYVGVVVIILFSYLMCCIRMPNQIFLNNYLQVCTKPKNIERALSIKIMVEYLGFAIISFVYSMLLGVYNDNLGLTNLTYIGIFAIPLIISLIFFIRALIKKYAQRYTIIKDEYTKD